jgi:hypothetical protein
MGAYDDLLARAAGDPEVLGLVLSGSQARGLGGPASDHDVFVIVDERSPAWPGTVLGPELDEIVMTRAELADTSQLWLRYSFRGSVLLLDRLDGQVAELVTAQAVPTPTEVDAWLRDDALDTYLNFAYRAAKSRRAGRPELARLDEWESVGWFLTTLFALHGRLRPYNKYLRWELDTYPLGAPWTADALLARLGVQPAAFFAELVALARARGYGDIVDAWGGELDVVGVHA